MPEAEAGRSLGMTRAASSHAYFPLCLFHMGRQDGSGKEGPGLIPSCGLILYLSCGWYSLKGDGKEREEGDKEESVRAKGTKGKNGSK